ncbi:phosphotransferase enzyme family protein [Rhexocercosporidium sp. MPI-PUGE-AT-0058]|nr:phosphotransferase enzyme family protein [Rhexocercosporidium sp. MPI-PUGE-AT-0058]
MASIVSHSKPKSPRRSLENIQKSFRDALVEARVHRARDQFIASIHRDDVCSLAASHHNGDACEFFKPPIRGSYNICYFVQFHSSNDGAGDRWVVRVPLAPCLAFGSRSKLESEVATMQLIAQKTTIPIPKIHAYALGDDDAGKPLSSFLILQYIEGQKLTHADLRKLSDEQRTNLYTSLADVYIQLRRLDFPSIGCLMQGLDGFKVCKRTVTIDLNMQELEGRAPHCVQSRYCGSGTTLTSANKYITMLLEISDNAFAGDRSPISQEEGEDRLYHLHIFRQYVNGWVNNNFEHGPFVLVHGDLELFNLLFDDNMNVISVLDWEWSRVVPCQFFKPPLWLNSTSIEDLSYGYQYKGFLAHFDKFLAVLRVLEQKKYGNEILANEWETGKQKSGFMVANALENWTAIDWFANRWINCRVYDGKKTLSSRITEFMQAEPTRQALIRRKVLRVAPSTSQHNDPNESCINFLDCAVQGCLARSWKTISLCCARPLPVAIGSLLLVAGVSLLFRRRR